MISRTSLALAASALVAAMAWTAVSSAQTYGQPTPAYGTPTTQPTQPGYPATQPGYPATQPAYGYPATQPGYGYPTQPGYGYPTTQPIIQGNNRKAGDIELGVLYGMSAAYGANLGIWLDTELGLDDPGLMFIAPVALGLAAPVGVYFANQPTMPKGLPAAMSAGMFLGAGEGMAIWTRQFTTANEADAWGWKGFSRSMTLGSTAGLVGGFAVGYFQEPAPSNSALVSSAAMWGTIMGSMIGYGSTPSEWDSFTKNNDGASLGGLIGYNVGMGAGAAMSMIYTPQWINLAWMWIGGGIGAAAGLPVYLAYAGSDTPARRGLIVQGLFTGIGVVAGGVFSYNLKDTDYFDMSSKAKNTGIAQLTGFGLMPVNGGAGLQVSGLLF